MEGRASARRPGRLQPAPPWVDLTASALPTRQSSARHDARDDDRQSGL